MRIGIDVGGTNTDAVLMDGTAVLAFCKTQTTPDVTSGITQALRTVLAESNVTATSVLGVMFGTTHLTNAILERKRITPVAAPRLGFPATQALPPMTDWPEDLRQAVGDFSYITGGGHEFEMIGVATGLGGDTERKVRAFAKRKGWDFTIVVADEQVLQDYSVSGIPTTFVLDREGTVRYSFIGTAEEGTFADAVEELLAERTVAADPTRR